MEDIDLDTLFMILLEVEPEDISNCARVNHLFNSIFSDDSYWKFYMDRLQIHNYLDVDKLVKDNNPKEICKLYIKLVKLKGRLNLGYSISDIEKIRELDRSNMVLYEIPKEISYLSDLRCLILENCDINIFTREITLCKNLVMINLSENNIEEIPEEIYNLRQLQILELKKNKIKMINNGIYRMENLRKLDMSHNNIEIITGEIINMKSLEELIMNNNKIRAIPQQIGYLENLTYYDFRNNNIEVIPYGINSNWYNSIYL